MKFAAIAYLAILVNSQKKLEDVMLQNLSEIYQAKTTPIVQHKLPMETNIPFDG